MNSLRLVAPLGALLAIIIAGCPQGSSPATGVDPNTPTTGGVSGVTDGATSDSLKDQFPNCNVSANEDEWRDEILRLVNVERQRAGLNPSHAQSDA